MKIYRTLLINIFLALLVASLIFTLSHKGSLERLELSGLDLMFRMRGALPINPHIVIVEITDDDISKIGRWPWPRPWHAALTRALHDMGARSVYFDIVFSEGAIEKDDDLFGEAIKQSGNVYLPFVFKENVHNMSNALLPIEKFYSHIKGFGPINIYPDMDGVIRKMPLIFKTPQGIYPHVILKMFLDYADLKLEGVEKKCMILSKTSSAQKIKIPLITKNEILINWAGKWQRTFKHVRFMDVLAAYKDLLQDKKPEIDIGIFKDSISIIGITAIGLYDIKPIPLQGEYPGIGINANVMNSLINENFIHEAPFWVNILILLILCLVPAFLVFGEKPLRETIFVVAVLAFYIFVNWVLFRQGVVLDLTVHFLGIFSSYILIDIYNFARIGIERRNFFKLSITDGLTGLFNIRYFRMLLETETLIAKADPTKGFCIIMSDVDHFKKFNDAYGHDVGDLVLKEVASVLKNSVRTSDMVARYGGEEMIALMRGTNLRNGLIIAEKIRKGVESHIVKDEKNTYKVSISLGVASFKSTDDAEGIVKRADLGLYKAKEGGRNRVETIEDN